MQSENLPTALRRSSRVPAELPIRVTSLSGARFSEVCKTLVVNAHGCALQTPMRFDTGIPLRFHSDDGRETTAHVVSCQPLGSGNGSWKLAAKLDRPENFWGLTNCPGDWSLTSPISIGQVRIVPRAAAQPAPSQADLNLESKLDLVAQRLEDPLRNLIAESLRPLEAQLAVLREIVARREANPSRFDVSLSSIPPQLEQQLEERLRKHLQPIVLHESRQQYADVLEAARSSIDKRTTEGYESFLRRVEDERLQDRPVGGPRPRVGDGREQERSESRREEKSTHASHLSCRRSRRPSYRTAVPNSCTELLYRAVVWRVNVSPRYGRVFAVVK